MESPFLRTLICITVIAASNSLPTSPTHQRLGSDEIRITQSNRDVCLAKLLCGMSVVTLQDVYDSGTKDGEIYGDYAQIVGKFFQENPPDEFDDGDEDGSLSKESVEAVLEDYSVSTEYEDEEDEEPLPIQFQRPKRPEPKRKVQKQKKRPGAPTTAAAPIQVKKVPPPPTPKPTPPGIQIFDLGRPIQESSKPRSPKALLPVFQSPQMNSRMSRARKIMRRAGLATKLRTVRQCQRISGCSYTFKQLYQKYGGKGVIDDVSQPIQPLPVVDEQLGRQPLNGITKVIFAETPSPLDNPWVSPADKSSPLNNPWVSPADTSSPSPPTPLDLDVEYGGMSAKIPTALEPYFQPSPNGASIPKLTNPGTAYKIKKTQKITSLFDSLVPSLKKKHRKKKVTTTTTEATTTTTTTTEPPTTSTTTTTTTTTTTPPPRRLVHYKRPPSKRKPQGGDDDEDSDDNINHTAPVHMIGNHEHDFDDEAVDHRQHQLEYEDEDDDDDRNQSHDDYDEEAKYNVPVDYGNDEESEENDDEEDRPIPTRERPHPRPQQERPPLKRKQRPGPAPARPTQKDEAQQGVDAGPGPGYAPGYKPQSQPSSLRPKYRPKPEFTKFTNEFQSVQSGRLKKLKKKRQEKEESKENTSEEPDADDADFQDDAGPPPFEYPTHIGGRPIFPDYEVPVTAYGMTRSTMQGKTSRRPPLQPQEGGGGGPPRGKSDKQSSQKNTHSHNEHYHQPYHYNYPSPGSAFDHPSGQDGGMGYEPTSGMSVLTPIKSLFKHLSSGISPNPVGGSMGYTQNQSPTSLHYKMPPPNAPFSTFGGSGSSGPQSGPHGMSSAYPPPGISVPIQQDESENSSIPQIAIMPQIPKGPESSEYKRPAKYTINKTKKIPTL